MFRMRCLRSSHSQPGAKCLPRAVELTSSFAFPSESKKIFLYSSRTIHFSRGGERSGRGVPAGGIGSGLVLIVYEASVARSKLRVPPGEKPLGWTGKAGAISAPFYMEDAFWLLTSQ